MLSGACSNLGLAVSLEPPASQEWQAGTLSNGRGFLWRQGNDPDDPEVQLLSGASGESKRSWNIGTLPSGREYLWRDSGDDDPEAKLWSQGTLDSGEMFWYDGSGEVTLEDPFSSARR